MSIRVLLADDHDIVREGLCALLESAAGIEVVAQASNGREAVSLARELRPDVAIMDVAMPDLNGVEATRKIREAIPSVRVVGLSIHSDKRFVRQMLLAGATGYLRKGCTFDELVRAVRTVMHGQTYLSPEIARTVTDDYTRRIREHDHSAAAVLTPREREILQLLAEGNRPKQIARSLDVSVKTVSTHRRNVMRKIGAESLADLTKYAIREGLTTLEL